MTGPDHPGFPIRCRTQAEIDDAARRSAHAAIDAILQDAIDDAAEQRRQMAIGAAIARSAARPAAGPTRAAPRPAILTALARRQRREDRAFVLACCTVGLLGIAAVVGACLLPAVLP